MIKYYLKASRWSLLSLLFVFPWFIYRLIFRTLMNWNVPENLSQYEKVIGVFFIYLLFVLFLAAISAWYWSVAIGLRKEIPEHIRPSTKIFKTAYIIFFSYLTLMLLSTFGFFVNDITPGYILFVSDILIQLLVTAAYFYTIYFVAKTIKTAERQEMVKFSAFAGEFFLLMIYIIGIGFLQPKINKLANQEQEGSLEEE